MKTPVIHPSAFIAPNATVLGDVTVGEVRFGPFKDKNITASGEISRVEAINGYFYAYVRGI